MSIRIEFNVTVAHMLNNLWQLIASPVVKRVRVVMSCGLTPQKLALTLCLGIAFGIIPLVWGTSLICIVLSQLFRLNHVALQSVNYLLWPAHLALLVPFFRLGAWLFPWGPPVPHHILAILTHGPGLSSLNILGWLTLKALAAWLVTVVPATLLGYGILKATVLNKITQPSG